MIYITGPSLVASLVENLPASAGDARETGSIPGSGRPPGGGHGNPLQYSYLKYPMDRGAWRATVHRIIKSWAQLSSLAHCNNYIYKIYKLNIYICKFYFFVKMSRYFPLSVLTCLRGSTCSPDFPAHPSTPAFVPGWFASLLGLHVLCWVEAGSLLQPDSLSKCRLLQTTSCELSPCICLVCGAVLQRRCRIWDYGLKSKNCLTC